MKFKLIRNIMLTGVSEEGGIGISDGSGVIKGLGSS